MSFFRKASSFKSYLARIAALKLSISNSWLLGVHPKLKRRDKTAVKDKMTVKKQDFFNLNRYIYCPLCGAPDNRSNDQLMIGQLIH